MTMPSNAAAVVAGWRERAVAGAGTPEYAQRAVELSQVSWVNRCRDRDVPLHYHDIVSGRPGPAGERFRETASVIAIDDALLHRRRTFVVLSGPPGSGKTVAVCRWLTRPDVHWTHGGELGKYFAAIDLTNEYNHPVYLATRWLPIVIDDLGTERDPQVRAVDAILQNRYGGRLITVCTTNLTFDQFAGRYDSRTVSRLRESGQWLEVDEIVRPGELGLLPGIGGS